MSYTNVTVLALGRNASVSIEATCPFGHSTAIPAEDSIKTTNSECDLCGDHGDIELWWFCAECDTGYIYTLDSW